MDLVRARKPAEKSTCHFICLAVNWEAPVAILSDEMAAVPGISYTASAHKMTISLRRKRNGKLYCHFSGMANDIPELEPRTTKMAL